MAVAFDCTKGDKIPLRWIPTRRGTRMPAYFIRVPGAYFTVLYSHANAEDLGQIRRHLYDVALRLKVNVLLYDYRGYGLHYGEGPPKEQDLYDDIESAFEYTSKVLGIPWQRIVLWGRSIGTAPTMHLASRRAVRGIILQSPMLSIFRIPLKLRFTLPGDLFVNIARAKDVECPALVMHGTADEIVPFAHGWKLWEMLGRRIEGCQALFVHGADHNHLEEHAGESFDDRVDTFLRSLEVHEPSDELMAQAVRTDS